MAPRSDRRPGFSRRAQYSIFTAYVLAGAGALAGLIALVVSIINPGAFSFLRLGATEVAAPAGYVSSGTRGAGRSALHSIGDYVDAGNQNARLREEVGRARVLQIEAEAIADENRRLKRLLGIVERDGKPVTSARLIASTSSSSRRFAVLGAGSRDGVTIRMPVRSAIGLVGRVLEVGPNTSRVLLITDSENVVPVRRARDGVAAFSTGRADGRLELRLINMGVNPLKKGDVFVTSGSGGLYIPNIPVAVVESLTVDGAVARILSDPSASEFVIVDEVFEEVPEPLPSDALAGEAP